MILKQTIETPRLRIRSYRDNDMSFCLSLWCDEENGRYMSDPVFSNIDERYLSCFKGMEEDKDGYYLIAELKENGMPVGTCCAFPEEGNYDIGYSIAKAFWKMGLGTEMIDALIRWIRSEGGSTVSCEVADANEASLALLRKFGFIQEKKTRYKKWGEETCFDAHTYRLVLDRTETIPMKDKPSE